MENNVLDKYTELILQGNKDIFITELGGLSFICKPLTYYQYKLCLDIEKNVGAPDSNEAILKLSIIFPERNELENWIDSTNACFPDILADKILAKSSFKSQEDIYSLYLSSRDDVEKDFIGLAQIYICTAFKAISPADIDKMPMKDIMCLLVKAEEALGKKINIEELFNIESEGKQKIPIPPGMESTAFDPFSKEYMLDPDNASPIPPEAFR